MLPLMCDMVVISQYRCLINDIINNLRLVQAHHENAISTFSPVRIVMYLVQYVPDFDAVFIVVSREKGFSV